MKLTESAIEPGFQNLNIEKIIPDRMQPRRIFNDMLLKELLDSTIKHGGISAHHSQKVPKLTHHAYRRTSFLCQLVGRYKDYIVYR